MSGKIDIIAKRDFRMDYAGIAPINHKNVESAFAESFDDTDAWEKVEDVGAVYDVRDDEQLFAGRFCEGRVMPQLEAENVVFVD